MLQVIFGVGVVALVLQIAGTSVTNDAQSSKLNNTENLNMEKMLGQWYGVRVSVNDEANPCHLVDFHKDQSNIFSMHSCSVTEWGFTCINITNLKISDQILGGNFFHNNTRSVHYEFSIPETDYDNYAVIQFHEIHKGKLYSNAIAILSRNKVLDAGQLDKLTTKYIGTGNSTTNSNDDCAKNNATRIYDT